MIPKTFYIFFLVRFYCVVFTFIVSVTGQICTRQQLVHTTSLVPYTYTYSASYYDRCWYGKCVKTKIKQSRSMRTVSKLDLIPVEECCVGYNNESENNTLICKPICLLQCENGYCKSPGECECNIGFEIESPDSNSCSPICFYCDHGTCAGPGNCQCEEGYTKLDDRCVPVCYPECRNGTCTAPGVCSCDEDYKLVNNNCVPHCEFPCGNGYCIEPDICECFEGYSYSDNCDPLCCKPKCDNCGRGNCYKPGVCHCEPGFKNEKGTCVLECRLDCGHGICVSPDKCECDQGYNDTRYGTVNETVCEPVCQNCEGTCVGPDVCTCEYPLEAKNVTHSGQGCDCFDDCLITCDKTICVSQAFQNVTDISDKPYDTDKVTLGIITTVDVEMMDAKNINDNVTPKEQTTIEQTIEIKNSDETNNKFENLSNKIPKQVERVIPVWVYVVSAVLLLVLLTLIVFIIVKRDIISKYIRRNNGSYEFEDQHSSL